MFPKIFQTKWCVMYQLYEVQYTPSLCRASNMFQWSGLITLWPRDSSIEGPTQSGPTQSTKVLWPPDPSYRCIIPNPELRIFHQDSQGSNDIIFEDSGPPTFSYLHPPTFKKSSNFPSTLDASVLFFCSDSYCRFFIGQFYSRECLPAPALQDWEQAGVIFFMIKSVILIKKPKGK